MQSGNTSRIRSALAHRLTINVITCIFLTVILWPAYHLFLEVKGPVWVRDNPITIDKTIVRANSPDTIISNWSGRFATECASVMLQYSIIKKDYPDSYENEYAIIWTGGRRPMIVDKDLKKTPGFSDSPVGLPIPPLSPGEYTYVITEISKCNPFVTWENNLAEFDITAE